MRIILIDAEKRQLTEATIDGEKPLEGLQKAVGGYIEVAVHLDDNDCIYVNEEGLFHSNDHWFYVEGAHQPFSGNGVVSCIDESGDTVDARISIDELLPKIKWMTRKEVAEWVVPKRIKNKFDMGDTL